MNNPKVIKAILYSAAIYNWYSAVTLIFYSFFMPINGMEPIPTHPMWITMLGSLIAAYGVGYFWAARDLLANIPLFDVNSVHTGKAHRATATEAHKYQGDQRDPHEV